MFNIKKTGVAFLSAAFGAVAVSGQTCDEVDANGVAFFPVGTTAITDEAFEECEDLKSVEIPNTVEIVEEKAFLLAENLEKLTFAADSVVTELGTSAFEQCLSLKSVEIPASVKIVGDFTFAEAKNMEKLTFEAGSAVTKLSRSAFTYCYSLKSVKIPASVESVGDYTFQSAKNMDELTFAVGSVVTKLGKKAFSYSGLKTIVLPDGLRDLGVDVFSYSNSLRNIILPNSITSMGTGADFFKGSCVADLPAVNAFFSGETERTNLVVCNCTQVAHYTECRAFDVSCALCSLWLPSHKPTT